MCLSSFQTVPVKSASLKGTWNAEWEMMTSPSAPGKPESHRMNGFMQFKDNGSVSITIYGYQGCIFSSDTIHNELNYKIEDDSLTIYNGEDQFQLSYLIESFSTDEIQLQLMEDIGVTLRKK